MTDKTEKELMDQVRDRTRLAIINIHELVKMKQSLRGLPLWSLVKDVWSHGAGYSTNICIYCNLDPNQPIGTKKLKNYKTTKEEL